MAVKWNKIFRGGVQRTTPETREAPAPAAGALLPGMIVTLSATGIVTLGVPADGAYVYVVSEPLFGSVDADLMQLNSAGARDTVRLHEPHSGDLYAARAVAAIALRDDLPLTVNATGQVVAAGVDDQVICYVDMPASAFPSTVTPTVANQLIPVKFK